jgi:biotin carboxylase
VSSSNINPSLVRDCLLTVNTSLGYLQILPTTPTSKVPSSIWSLDVLIQSKDKVSLDEDGEHPPHLNYSGTDSPIGALFLTILNALKDNPTAVPVQLRFLFPSACGYISRSDFLQQRFEFSECISKVTSFLAPLQSVSAVEQASNASDLNKLLPKAIGVLTLKSTISFQDLDAELNNRLSFEWLLPTTLLPRRIAWVQGREDSDCIERAFNAAAVLGISLVILDEAGHWLQDPASPWAHLREAFIEIDISSDDRLAERVVDAVRSYPHNIDGIVTISDVRLASIARACAILGLPTERAEVYDIAADKGRTRMLETIGVEESFVLPDADSLDFYLAQKKEPLKFPLVVKPVIGWCSDCVSKVRSLPELAFAVRKASARHANSPKPSTAVVVEPYVDGPEVDANLVLLDGEVLFCEISDDFPSPADSKDAGVKANFQETQNVMPSGLPQIEQDAIRSAMRDSILRQGFKSGVFHCEARVRNSRVEYTTQYEVLDLAVKTNENATGLEEPQIYLHEINARPPGYLESVAVMLAYGVDYYALRMLLALGPEEIPRLHALSQPFLEGPQFHLSLMIIQQTRAGLMKTPDAAKEFLEKHPAIRANVVDYYTRKKGGDVLEGPDAEALWWVAFLSVVDRHSRMELLKRVEFVQENFTYEIEAEKP